MAHVINTIMMSDNDENTISTTQPSTRTLQKKKLRLIVMGGGYDTRSIKLLERSLLMNETILHYDSLKQKKRNSKRKQQRWWKRFIRRRPQNKKKKEQHSSTLNNNAFDNITTSSNYELECYELDLPEVVVAKRKLLQTRLVKRRPWLHDSIATGEYPKLISVDFNNLQETKDVLERILLLSSSTNSTDYSNDREEEKERTYDNDDVYNIILFEGVMIYLNEGIPHSLLGLCSSVLNNANTQSSSSLVEAAARGYLCFADRLENIPGGDEKAANVEMESTGWELIDWLSKPGLARHMGLARLL